MDNYIKYLSDFNKAGFSKSDGLLSHSDFNLLNEEEVLLLYKDLNSQKLKVTEYNPSVEIVAVAMDESYFDYEFFKEHKQIKTILKTRK